MFTDENNKIVMDEGNFHYNVQERKQPYWGFLKYTKWYMKNELIAEQVVLFSFILAMCSLLLAHILGYLYPQSWITVLIYFLIMWVLLFKACHFSYLKEDKKKDYGILVSNQIFDADNVSTTVEDKDISLFYHYDSPVMGKGFIKKLVHVGSKSTIEEIFKVHNGYISLAKMDDEVVNVDEHATIQNVLRRFNYPLHGNYDKEIYHISYTVDEFTPVSEHLLKTSENIANKEYI